MRLLETYRGFRRNAVRVLNGINEWRKQSLFIIS